MNFFWSNHMKTLIYCKNDAMLDGFKFGAHFRKRAYRYTQGVDEHGYWLIFEDDELEENQIYELTDNGLHRTDTGVEI